MPASKSVYKYPQFLSLVPPQRTQTILRRLYDVIKRSQSLLIKLDAITTFARRRRIYDIFKTSDLRCLEDIRFKTY